MPHRTIVLLAFSLLLTSFHATLAEEDKDASLPNFGVQAFYYPWYRTPAVDGGYQHWNHAVAVRKGPPSSFPGGDDIGANFYPQLGCYSTNDRRVVREQMRQMREAGIGVVSVSWWGAGSDTDRNVPLLLDEAERAGLKVNFHIEPFAGRTAITTRAAITRIINAHGKHPAFYRYAAGGNRPLFYVYDSYLIPAADWAEVLSPQGEQTIRGGEHDAVVIGLWVKEGDGRKMLEGHFDGFYTYFATDGFTYGSTIKNWPELSKWAEEHQKIFVPCVGPGYNDLRIRPWNGRNLRGRENGAYYDRMFAAAIAARADLIGITSYNEWHEGTQIEPAVPKKIPGYKYEDYGERAPEYYLERTKHWSTRFRPAEQ